MIAPITPQAALTSGLRIEDDTSNGHAPEAPDQARPTWLPLHEAQPTAQASTHTLCLRHPAHAGVLGTARVTLARDVPALAELFEPAALARTAWITDLRVEADAHWPALLYAVGRRARILGAATVLGAPRTADHPAATLGQFTPLAGRDWPEHALMAARLDVLMHAAFDALAAAGDAPVPTLYAAEVEETVRRWVADTPRWKFFAAVAARKLARQQYVYALGNLYQFVRHTTRIIGKAIGHSEDPDLRRHWINHLNGEINHEVIIEQDLAHMGEDADFVKTRMVPSAHTQEFMAIQESMVEYYHDPVLVMASPLAAEAVTAYLDQTCVDNLNACVASWGVDEPTKATRFLTSHMSFDGGEDGHWRMSIEKLKTLLKSEAQLARFLRVNESSRRAIAGIWDACVDDLGVWSPR